MPKGTRICRVCGVEYPYCATATTDKFRWQDVACCPEHGVEYFREVSVSRGEQVPELIITEGQKIVVGKPKSAKETSGKKIKDKADKSEEKE